MLSAVRHHPTAHPDWGAVGLLLYVADFCEPGRPFAGRLGTARIRERAEQGESGLAEAARRVLGLRLAAQMAKGMEVHPLTLGAWRRWLPESD